MWLYAQSAGGLVTVPFEFVAVFVGILFTGGVLYLVRKYVDERR